MNTIGQCEMCGMDVMIVMCHYMCTQCGYAVNWEDGQKIDENQLDLFNKDTTIELFKDEGNKNEQSPNEETVT